MFRNPDGFKFTRKICFSGKNSMVQIFPLPKPIMNLMLNERIISPQLLLKLYQTCKYFWPKLKVLPCERSLFTLSGMTMGYGSEYYAHEFSELNDLKFCISGTLTVYQCVNNSTQELLNTFFAKSWFYKIEIMSLKDITITMKNYKKVASNIANLKLISVKVTDSDGSNVPVEELLKYTPNVYKFY